MSLLDLTRANLRQIIRQFGELADLIPEPSLNAKLPGLPSNTVGQQLWCVIGARESFRRAIAAGKWSGFSCSLPWESCGVKREVLEALSRSGAEILEAVSGGESFTDPQNRLMLDALEHEASHQGQLLRYLLALELPIPASWKSRYALD